MFSVLGSFAFSGPSAGQGSESAAEGTPSFASQESPPSGRPVSVHCPAASCGAANPE